METDRLGVQLIKFFCWETELENYCTSLGYVPFILWSHVQLCKVGLCWVFMFLLPDFQTPL